MVFWNKLKVEVGDNSTIKLSFRLTTFVALISVAIGIWVKFDEVKSHMLFRYTSIDRRYDRKIMMEKNTPELIMKNGLYMPTLQESREAAKKEFEGLMQLPPKEREHEVERFLKMLN